MLILSNAGISRENKLDTNVECIKDPDGNRSYNGVVITRAGSIIIN